jgi:hypothetical protein
MLSSIISRLEIMMSLMMTIVMDLRLVVIEKMRMTNSRLNKDLRTKPNKTGIILNLH